MSSMDPPPPAATAARKKESKQPAPTAAGVVEAVRSEIVHQARARPYVTVFAAAATGYVIGAGSPRWITNIAWEAARRALVARVVSSLVNA